MLRGEEEDRVTNASPYPHLGKHCNSLFVSVANGMRGKTTLLKEEGKGR